MKDQPKTLIIWITAKAIEDLKNNFKRAVGTAIRKLIPSLMTNAMNVALELYATEKRTGKIAGNVFVMILGAKLRSCQNSDETK